MCVFDIAAIGALATFRPPPEEVLEKLSRTLKDPDNGVKMATVGALRQMGFTYPEKVTELLQSALQVEKNEQARRSMASALAGIGKAEAGCRCTRSSSAAKYEAQVQQIVLWKYLLL